MTVLFGTTVGPRHQWLDRWINCFKTFTYPHKECLITTDVEDTQLYIGEKYPFVKTILFDPLDGIFNGKPSGLHLMAEGKNRVNNYVCRNPHITWLLLADSDLEFTPDAIERFMFFTGFGFDVVWTTNVGACMFLHRDVCDSIHFWSTTCHRDHTLHIEENFEVLRQIQHINTFFLPYKHRDVYRIKAIPGAFIRHLNKPWGNY